MKLKELDNKAFPGEASVSLQAGHKAHRRAMKIPMRQDGTRSQTASHRHCLLENLRGEREVRQEEKGKSGRRTQEGS